MGAYHKCAHDGCGRSIDACYRFCMAHELDGLQDPKPQRFNDANLWSGIYRVQKPRTFGESWQQMQTGTNPMPTLVITVRPRYWSLPFSVSLGGHLLSKPGLTFGVGPFYLSWSIL